MDKSFWNNLARKNKTTGYRDYPVAVFDQLMRIKCIDQLLSEYNIYIRNCPSLLDFGCGTGDFLKYFRHKFSTLVGYDLSDQVLRVARGRLGASENIVLTDSLAAVDSSFDVILSITVLQHILDDEQLRSAIGELSLKCKDDGFFIALESIEDNRVGGLTYLKARSLSDWVNEFEFAGFELLETRSFYNPYYIRTSSFLVYLEKIKFALFLYGGLRKLKINTKLFNWFFEKQAKRILNQNVDGFVNEESFSKVFVLRKVGG